MSDVPRTRCEEPVEYAVYIVSIRTKFETEVNKAVWVGNDCKYRCREDRGDKSDPDDGENGRSTSDVRFRHVRLGAVLKQTFYTEINIDERI